MGYLIHRLVWKMRPNQQGRQRWRREDDGSIRNQKTSKIRNANLSSAATLCGGKLCEKRPEKSKESGRLEQEALPRGKVTNRPEVKKFSINWRSLRRWGRKDGGGANSLRAKLR